MEPSKIFISTTTYGEYDRTPIRKIEEKGFRVEVNPYGRKLTGEEIVELAVDAIGIIAGTEILDKAVLERLPLLKVLSRCGTGLDNIDLKAAEELNIRVFNTPDAPTLAVAELTVGLILNLLRKVNKMDSIIRHNGWEKTMGNLLYGKKIGIIGFGRIGRKVAELLRIFNCEIAYTDPFVEEGLAGPKRLSLREQLECADIISIHTSGKDKLFGANEFSLIRKGAWIVNVARGGIVDEGALYQALKEGHLAGAALDVFEHEPYNGSLKEFDNVILTPHIGSYAKESRINMEIQAAENLLKGLEVLK